jgi:hypothetical protein
MAIHKKLPYIRNIHLLTSHPNILKIGVHIHRVNPQKFDVAIFDISIFVDFMRLNVPISASVGYV